MLVIKNNGPLIIETNYWDTSHALAGFFYLSWNAGAGRLFIPDSQLQTVAEVTGSREVIVSRGKLDGREGLELMFEDDSDAPFAIHLVSEQTDRLLPANNQGGGFVVTLWTRQGCVGTFPGKYRQVATLPCLDPWMCQ